MGFMMYQVVSEGCEEGKGWLFVIGLYLLLPRHLVWCVTRPRHPIIHGMMKGSRKSQTFLEKREWFHPDPDGVVEAGDTATDLNRFKRREIHSRDGLFTLVS